MGQVIQLKTKPFPTRPKEKPQYFCKNCSHEQFLLFPNGEICCANCGSVINNLKLGDI